MTVKELYERGLTLRKRMFGADAVEKRMQEEIREILLLVALYCGIPAANDAHRIAHEVFKARAA